MIKYLSVIGLLLFFLSGCTEAVPRDKSARILTMGDSMLAWHSGTSRSVSHAVEDILHEPVVDRSVSGARVFYNLPVSGALGMNINQQYRPNDWDWVILNGGGNDLWLGCGCVRCERRMNRMIARDGRTGAIADIVANARADGAQVIYVGYLRSPGFGSVIDHCRDEGDELEARLARMAQSDSGVYFVSLKDLVPYGDKSYHVADRIHPSVKASREIAKRIAGVIDAN
ncbi:MAG: SGNH/GDSL hydrolase family protein [Pseudomonadota bacterium]